MIKGGGYAAVIAFLVLGSQMGSVEPGFVFTLYCLLVVVLGAVGYSLVQVPNSLVDGSAKKIEAFHTFDPKKLVQDFEHLALAIRRDGLLASEATRKELSDPFLRYLLKRIMDGFERAQLIQAIHNQSIRTHEVASFVEAWIENTAQALPTAGLVASLFEMMAVMKSSDAALSPALALIPLLIGVVLQPLVSAYFKNPFFANLDRARLYFILMEEGVAGIQDGINSDFLRDKLNCRLQESPKWLDQ